MKSVPPDRSSLFPENLQLKAILRVSQLGDMSLEDEPTIDNITL